MPKGKYERKNLGNKHHMWKGGFPNCELCGTKLTQYRSPSALKRGVKSRCRKCFKIDVKGEAETKKVCMNGCGSKVSRAGNMCIDCFHKSSKGKHRSPNTEWKPGNIPTSHLRSNFGSKFNISHKEDRTYDGIVYHSKMEMLYAQYLDLLVKAGEIEKWCGQNPLDITINGKLLSRYFCDFKLFFKDGHTEYHEVKGYVTELYALKKKAVESLYGIKIIEIKQKDMKKLKLV